MFSVLKGEEDYKDENDTFSTFDDPPDEILADVNYNKNIPIGEFDFIVIDECHRSIYNKWRQVLDYFDSFLIGLTATPLNDIIGFFNNNQVMLYNPERAIVDEVNIGYNVYKIRTKITDQGSTVDADQFVEKEIILRVNRRQKS